MAIDKEIVIRPDSGEPTLFVQARDYMGPKQVVIERTSGGFVVLSLAEARQLIVALRRAIEAFEPPVQK